MLPGSKYYPLYEFLRLNEAASITLSFTQIEHILGVKLPDSARTHRAFWSNRRKGALQALAWIASGFSVTQIDLEAEHVTLAKGHLRHKVRREGDQVLWDGGLIRNFREELGWNQTQLADKLGVRQQTVSEWEREIYLPTRARSKHLSLIAERAGFNYDPNLDKNNATV